MSYQNLLWEVSEGIAKITVNRAEKLNALNRATLEDLDRAFGQAAADSSIGAVILTGAGPKSFIAGADIGELAQLTAIEGREYALFGQSVLNHIQNLGKPVLAAINGFALGGGCEVALACTLRLASSQAKLGQPEVKLGIIPGYGGTQRLARLIGKGKALELVITGEMIDAQEAHRLGLVNEVVAPEELMPRCVSLAKTILARGPLAVRYALDATQRGLEMPLEEGLAYETALFAGLCSSQDMKEGTQAFLEKRKPDFKGL